MMYSVYLIEHLPGCEEDAGDITGQYADMDNLPDIITHVRSALNISGAMVLLGVGAGANIGGYNVHGLTWCGSWC